MIKRGYKLRDIEAILTFVPPIFIVVVSLILIVATYITIGHLTSSKIELLIQQREYNKQTLLNKYIDKVSIDISQRLDIIKKELKKNIHIAKGIYVGLGDGYTSQKLFGYLEELETKEGIKFLVFDSSLNILKGRKIAENIERLIFNDTNNSRHLDIALLYLFSQGDSSYMSWSDDLHKTIQLSRFENSYDQKLHIGVFSSVDSLYDITLQAYMSAISKNIDTDDGFYLYIEDNINNRVYNLHNRQRWSGVPKNLSDKGTYSIDKVNLTIGVLSDTQAKSSTIESAENRIREKAIVNRNLAIASILLVAISLIAFSIYFSRFIKMIFGDLNRRVERKSAVISKLKDRYELAVIASNDGMWDTDFETKATFFSQKWLDMLGYDRGDIDSYEDWLRIIHPDDLSRVRGTIQRYSDGNYGEHIISEYRVLSKNKGYIWVLGRGKILFDNQNRPKKLSMMSMDISEKKALTTKMEHLVQSEVTKNQEKQKMLIQQNKLAAMGEMIGSIAHQWRQPLNNISLILHFIRDNAKNEEFIDKKLDKYVDKAKKQITYMSDTIDDFRNFYRPSKQKSSFSAREAINLTLSIMQLEIEKSHIEVELSDNDITIYGHENEFRQAILNIISNANDAIKSKMEITSSFQGKIVIMMKEDEITIYNNGGIATSEVLDRMFEPYFTTKFEGKGTGIGLYMTRAIIEESMHGEIAARNVKDGVIFTIKGLK